MSWKILLFNYSPTLNILDFRRLSGRASNQIKLKIWEKKLIILFTFVANKRVRTPVVPLYSFSK